MNDEDTSTHMLYIVSHTYLVIVRIRMCIHIVVRFSRE
jgi:hypothetical protein